jgi:hypothetical protein
MLDIDCLLFKGPALIFQAFENQDRQMQFIEAVQHAPQLGLIPMSLKLKSYKERLSPSQIRLHRSNTIY